jgi:hypothetical protein
MRCNEFALCPYNWPSAPWRLKKIQLMSLNRMNTKICLIRGTAAANLTSFDNISGVFTMPWLESMASEIYEIFWSSLVKLKTINWLERSSNYYILCRVCCSYFVYRWGKVHFWSPKSCHRSAFSKIS